MFKHTQTIRCLLPTNCLRVFDHFVRLALRELRTAASQNISGKLILFGSANKTFILLVNYLRQNFLRKSITATAVNIFLCQSFILDVYWVLNAPLHFLDGKTVLKIHRKQKKSQDTSQTAHTVIPL